MNTNPTSRKLADISSTLDAVGKLAGQQEGTNTRMPSIFIGHGSPMNTVMDNAFTRTLTSWGAALPRPKAILAVSAHWQTPGQTLVDVQPHPQVIYDFYNFPQALYEIQYPAPGAPEIAMQVASMVKLRQVVPNTEWGIDHGTWTVLRFMFPQADVPIFQLSIDYSAPGEVHHAIGQELQALRDQGVMIIGSGNITHNLRRVDRSVEEGPVSSQPWSQEFDDGVKKALQERDDAILMDYLRFGDCARISAEMPDHYWPLLYTVGAAQKDEALRFTYESFQAGTLSMRCFQFG